MTATLVAAPTVRLSVAGVPMPNKLLAAVTLVEVEQRLGRPAQLRVTLSAQRLDMADALLRSGTKVRAAMDGHDTELFDGTLTGAQRTWTVDGGQRIVIRAADQLAALSGERRSESFEGTDPITIAEQVVNRHGLGLQADRTTRGAEVVHQVAETDLQFLTRLLASQGLVLCLRGSTVHVTPRDGLGSTLTLRPGEDLHELSIDRRLDDPLPTRISGWDRRNAEAVESGAGDQLGGWTLSAETASLLAEAASARTRLDQLVASAVGNGDTRVRPGTRIALRDAAGSLTDGEDVVVTTSAHRIDAASGYVTRFSTEPIDDRLAAPPTVSSLGIVTDVDDPEGLGRVRVELATDDGLVTDWMPVLCMGAGDAVGIVALPDIGASVMLLGPADEPGNGVVLGGLFGQRELPGTPIVDGRSATFVARLPGGGQVAIHDADGRLVVENGTGSRIDMTPDAMTLHAASDMEIAAPGQRLLITADTIDFERG